MVSPEINIVTPKLGEGIYYLKDISAILGLDYSKVKRWIMGYWDNHFKTTFGDGKNKAINFYSLIEFYTFYKLREKGISAQQLKQIHDIMSTELSTIYPFAKADAFNLETKKSRHSGKAKKVLYYSFEENFVKADGKHQLLISDTFLADFLEKIEYDKNKIARRFFPLENSKNIVVDPHHQFGQPIIAGTNIKTKTIYQLYLGGESNETICILYKLTNDKVQDAIDFHLKQAA